MRKAVPRTLPGLLLLVPAMAMTGPVGLVGSYTHGYTGTAHAPVWRLEPTAAGHEIETVGSGEREPAWLLDAAGRAAFWHRMTWDSATAGDAECVSWGVKPPTLADLFATPADAATSPAPGAAPAPGAGVLCRVEPGTRARIPWLSDNQSDYFYYDPFLGVMEVARLPAAAASPAGPAR